MELQKVRKPPQHYDLLIVQFNKLSVDIYSHIIVPTISGNCYKDFEKNYLKKPLYKVIEPYSFSFRLSYRDKVEALYKLEDEFSRATKKLAALPEYKLRELELDYIPRSLP